MEATPNNPRNLFFPHSKIRKTALRMAIALTAVICTSLASCTADEPDSQPQTYELPALSRSFLDTFYEGILVQSVDTDTRANNIEYDVRLQNKQEVRFDKTGRWQRVSAPPGNCIPPAILLVPVSDYLEMHWPDAGVNSINRTSLGCFELVLTTGDEVHFDASGRFLCVMGDWYNS